MANGTISMYALDKPVTEFDLRAEEFKHPDVKPELMEFRSDGQIVRKDRWERGIRRLASLFDTGSAFEIDDLLGRVEALLAEHKETHLTSDGERIQAVHQKTHGEYEILFPSASVTFQCEGEMDMTGCIIYRKPGTSEVWVRPTAEFYDGRFEVTKHET